MNPGWIDLHTHTTASDGSLTPSQLVEAAVSAGLEAVAVTDHDTADGVDEALEAGLQLGIRVIPGIEITALMDDGILHLLGYEIDPHEEGLASCIAQLKKARAERNPKIIGKLQEMGIPIELSQVESIAGRGQVGRPHMAEALFELGAVSSLQEAFDRYLSPGSCAYVPKFRFEPGAVLQFILGAGGIPVMAHPYQTNLEGEELRRLVADLREQGLEGIEVHYSYHTPEQSAFYRELAEEFDLVQTGGTDFHGERKKDIELGRGRGDLRVPAALLEQFDLRISRLRRI